MLFVFLQLICIFLCTYAVQEFDCLNTVRHAESNLYTACVCMCVCVYVCVCVCVCVCTCKLEKDCLSAVMSP